GVATTNTTPPSINTAPQSQTVSPGANPTFTVNADGAPTLLYQWRFFGTNLADATSSSFTRTNAQTADAGPYSVVVSNNFGSITSAPASLTVSVSVPNSPLIAQWNFNSPMSDAATTTGTLNPSTGSGTSSYVGGTTPSSTGFAGGSTTDT